MFFNNVWVASQNLSVLYPLLQEAIDRHTYDAKWSSAVREAGNRVESQT